jgi:hypothetical protein
MEFEGKRAGGVGVSDDFDIGADVGQGDDGQGVVKFGAGGYFRGVPAVAAESLWQFSVAPVRDVIVFDGGFFTEKPLDEVTGRC